MNEYGDAESPRERLAGLGIPFEDVQAALAEERAIRDQIRRLDPSYDQFESRADEILRTDAGLLAQAQHDRATALAVAFVRAKVEGVPGHEHSMGPSGRGWNAPPEQPQVPPEGWSPIPAIARQQKELYARARLRAAGVSNHVDPNGTSGPW